MIGLPYDRGGLVGHLEPPSAPSRPPLSIAGQASRSPHPPVPGTRYPVPLLSRWGWRVCVQVLSLGSYLKQRIVSNSFGGNELQSD